LKIEINRSINTTVYTHYELYIQWVILCIKYKI